MSSSLEIAPEPTSVIPSRRGYRIRSLDTLRGLLMVLMAIDHTRDYFSGATVDPADPVHSWPALFFTRWITHLCAPGFILLAGASVYLQRRRKSAATVTRSLILRGLWLILLEVTVISFGWSFAVGQPIFQVIWVIGVSMILLAGLQWLPLPALGAFGLLLVFGHDLLDGIHAANLHGWSDIWVVLHERGWLTFHHHPVALYGYPAVPWIGVMALGYCYGAVVARAPAARQRLSILIGTACLGLFAILRSLRGYGDPGRPFEHLSTFGHSAMSFLSVRKYPPSLHYLLATLGTVLLLFAWIDYISESGALHRVRGFLDVFGRVPFFFYALHIYLIHGIALAVALVVSPDWRFWVTPDVVFTDHLVGWGYGLPIVYLIWAAVILTLYPVCLWFGKYKDRNNSWWLTYL